MAVPGGVRAATRPDRQRRFLAGYRREWLINGEALAHVRSCREDLVGLRIDDAERRLAQRVPLPYVRSALMDTLWRQELLVRLPRVQLTRGV